MSGIGQRLKKRVALFRITQRLIRQRGVTPLMYQYGETVITPTKEVARVVRRGNLTTEKTILGTVRRNYAHSVKAQFHHGSLFLSKKTVLDTVRGSYAHQSPPKSIMAIFSVPVSRRELNWPAEVLFGSMS